MKEIWCDLRSEKKELLKQLILDNTCKILISYGQVNVFRNVKNVLVVEVKSKEEVEALDPKDILLIDNKDIELFKYAKEKNYLIANEYYVYDKKTMINATESEAEYVVTKFKDITNIPLELILATTQLKKNKVIKVVNDCNEAEIAFGTMESGCDGVVAKVDKVNEITDLTRRLNEKTVIELKRCKITEITHLGIGTRMCIDTIDLLEKNEGCIVGSTINGGILVSSETHYLPYMNLRPFRVNAGGIHSYILSEQDKTIYMSEIESGSKVMIVDTNGRSRQVTVGRAKAERRPMIKIAAKVDDTEISVIVQDDWHIRVFDGECNVISIMDLKVGDEIMGYCNIGPRHVGIRIQEKICER